MRHLSDFQNCLLTIVNASYVKKMIMMHRWHDCQIFIFQILHIQPAHGARVGLCNLKNPQNTVTAASCKFFFLAYEKIVEFTISSIAFKRFRNGTAKFFTEKIFTLFLSHALIDNADCIQKKL